MKNNIMMRLSALLLVAVLLTTCVISGTFAKYVTSEESTDEAQVAKWGVTITAPDQENLFASSYNNENVKTTASYELVAPNTTGALADFAISGSPEVAVDVTYTAELTLTNWKVEGAEYMPLVFTVNNEKYFVGKSGISDIASLIDAVEAAIGGVTANYKVGETIQDTLVVSWEWEYEKITVPGQTDKLDTALGDIAANSTAPTISLTVTCTVTQAQ